MVNATHGQGLDTAGLLKYLQTRYVSEAHNDKVSVNLRGARLE